MTKIRPFFPLYYWEEVDEQNLIYLFMKWSFSFIIIFNV